MSDQKELIAKLLKKLVNRDIEINRLKAKLREKDKQLDRIFKGNKENNG